MEEDRGSYIPPTSFRASGVRSGLWVAAARWGPSNTWKDRLTLCVTRRESNHSSCDISLRVESALSDMVKTST